jgi:hypothetical protein
MTRVLLLMFLIGWVYLIPAWATNQVLLRYLDIGDSGNARVLTSDSAGHLFSVWTVTAASGRSLIRVIKTESNGTPLVSFDIGGDGSPTSAATDAQGNLVIVGAAGSRFPRVMALFPSVTGPAGFILKLDSELRGIVFSTLLKDVANAVAIDTAGNIYVTGSTSAADFPITPNAYQTRPPAHDGFGTAHYAFLTEISSNGQRLLYSTYFGADAVNCIGGSRCIGAFGGTSGRSLALDRSGSVLIAGVTNARDLPVTPGTLATACVCSYFSGAGFIAKLSPGAERQLEWSTFLNPTQTRDFQLAVEVDALALDAAGDIVMAGRAPNVFFTTAGVVQPRLPVSAQAGGFIAKLNNAGTSLIWSTYFGSYITRGVSALAADAQGRIVATGYSDANSLPPVPGVTLVQNSSFVKHLLLISKDIPTLRRR